MREIIQSYSNNEVWFARALGSARKHYLGDFKARGKGARDAGLNVFFRVHQSSEMKFMILMNE